MGDTWDSSKTHLHSEGLSADRRLEQFIDERVQTALAGLQRRVVHVYIRLYRGREGCTCYIRIDLAPSGGVARGDSGEDAFQAVERASGRLRAAVVELIRRSTSAGE